MFNESDTECDDFLNLVKLETGAFVWLCSPKVTKRSTDRIPYSEVKLVLVVLTLSEKNAIP